MEEITIKEINESQNLIFTIHAEYYILPNYKKLEMLNMLLIWINMEKQNINN